MTGLECWYVIDREHGMVEMVMAEDSEEAARQAVEEFECDPDWEHDSSDLGHLLVFPESGCIAGFEQVYEDGEWSLNRLKPPS